MATIIKRSSKEDPLTCIEYDNNLDATLDRSNHTGTQLASTISNLYPTVESFLFIQDLKQCCTELRNRVIEISAEDVLGLYETVGSYDYIQDLQECCEELSNRIDELVADLFEEGGQLLNLLEALELGLRALIDINTAAISSIQVAITTINTDIATIQTDLSTKAPIDNPNFSGIPTVPDPTPSSPNSQIVNLGYTKTLIEDSVPIGLVLPYVGTTAPNALWLVADGQTVDRSSYPELADLMGVPTTAPTFTIPDLRSRVPMGTSTTYSMYSSGGAAEVSLNASQLPSHSHDMGHGHTASQGAHNHNVRDNGHFHSLWVWQGGEGAYDINTDAISGRNASIAGEVNALGGYSNTNGVGNQLVGTAGANIAQDSVAPAISVSSHSGNTGLVGSGDEHNNLQPYYVLNYIIKVL